MVSGTEYRRRQRRRSPLTEGTVDNYSSLVYSLTIFQRQRAINVSFGELEWTENVAPIHEDGHAAKRQKQQNNKWDPISRKTLIRYIELLDEKIQRKIKDALPEMFGLIFDGKLSKHYITVFATVCLQGAKSPELLQNRSSCILRVICHTHAVS